MQNEKRGRIARPRFSIRKALVFGTVKNGKIDLIEELDEKLLPYGAPESSMAINRVISNATVNVVALNVN